MDCKDVKETLGALIDNEVSDTEKEALLSHIAECEECRKEYEELQALKKDFAKLDTKLKGALAESVMQRVYAESFPKKKKPFFIRYAGTAAAIILVCTLFIYTRLFPVNEESQDNAFSPESEIVTDTAVDSEPKDEAEEIFFSKVEADILMPEASGNKLQSDKIYNETFADTTLADVRLYNSIPTSSAVIIVDAEADELLSVLDNAVTVNESVISIDEGHDEVLQVLYSNSITVVKTDIPEDTEDTFICIE